MTIAQNRKQRAASKAGFYKNLAVSTGFILLGNLSQYRSLAHGCYVLLAIATLAVNLSLIATVLGNLAKADRLRKSKVQQQLSLLACSALIYIILFVLGSLI